MDAPLLYRCVDDILVDLLDASPEFCVCGCALDVMQASSAIKEMDFESFI